MTKKSTESRSKPRINDHYEICFDNNSCIKNRIVIEVERPGKSSSVRTELIKGAKRIKKAS